MKIVRVKFCSDNKLADYEIDQDQYKKGDLVLINTNQIKELAYIIDITEKTENKNEGKIIRAINQKDKEKIEKLNNKAKKLIPQCIEKIKKYKLGCMKIVDADLSFDEKKLTIYFTAEERVDFRVLVSDLVRSFKKIIRLQQVSARDQAKYFCAFGKCGRETCCSTHLINLEEISFDLAKEQGLIDSGATRAMGNCGRPMCCLKYEVETYRQALAKMPKIGLKLKTKQGMGEIIDRNICKNTVTVRLPDKTKIEIGI